MSNLDNEYAGSMTLPPYLLELCKEATQLWGKDQELICAEECSELIKEILKHNYRSADNRVEILKEIADVLITMQQVVYLLDGEELLKECIELKAKKFKGYIEKAKNNEKS